MSTATSIEWTQNADGTPGKTWNPVRGCSVVSPGCVNCYAMKQAHRFQWKRKEFAMGTERVPGPFHGLTKQTKAGPQWTGVVRTVDAALLEPLSWKKPQLVFVNSMSDLFHEDVPDQFIDRVFHTMARAKRHTFQVLTKRPARMLAWFTRIADLGLGGDGKARERSAKMFGDLEYGWPLPNVWLGVSVEDQHRADERIPLLLQTPAAVRFISAEPLLGPVDLTRWLNRGSQCDCGIHRGTKDGCEPAKHMIRCNLGLARLSWVIAGGESGPGARPCAMEWIERIVAQCQAASVPVFVKQLGAYVVSEERTAPADMMSNPAEALRHFSAPNGEVWAWRMGTSHRKGGNPSEWPEDLRVRDWPR